MNEQESSYYLPYDEHDRTYFGCRKVIEAEWEYIRKRRKNQGLDRTSTVAPEEEDKSGTIVVPERDRQGRWWLRLTQVLIHTVRWRLPASPPLLGGPWETKQPGPPPDLTGIALSGGGIRSASFCLGVLQALAHAGWLKKLDYLSTISGGGYVGGALNWFLHKTWKGPDGKEIAFGLDRTTFPFGSDPMVGTEAPGLKDEEGNRSVYKGRLLRHLRQHANYLRPGHGINIFSLLATLLRNTVFSLFVYGGLLVLLFLLLGPILYDHTWAVKLYEPVRAILDWLPEVDNMAQGLAVLIALLFVVAGALYAVLTFSLPREVSTGYNLRRFYVRWLGYLLAAFVVALVTIAIPPVYNWIDALNNNLAALVAAFSTLLGSMSSLWAFFQAGKAKPKVPTAVPVALASFGLIFGALLLAYLVAVQIWTHLYLSSPWETLPAVSWLDILPHAGLALPLTAILFLVFLAFPNLNYLSLHRYYRDRLMETFTPDLPDAADVNGALPGGRKSADHTHLHQILADTNEPGRLGPYPIINANIVLVSSQIPKFRARGGDNFIMTPKYCGSNATGWCKSNDKTSPYESMTLPTALAISGAAINSNTGSAGDGLTRTPWLSFLMGFLNIRLGYWAPNPTPDKVRLERIAASLDRDILAVPQRDKRPAWAYEAELVVHGLKIIGLWPLKQLHMAVHHLLSLSFGTRSYAPKAIYPGLLEIFMRTNLDENSRLVQLSDGGHFENLGLYELIRRRLKLIIVCDGTEDPNFGFESLGNAMEKVRADFGTLIELNASKLESITPARRTAPKPEDAVAYAERGYLMAKIIYNDGEEGLLLYLTTTLFKAVTADIYGYRKAHKPFPDQPTSDQFFDEMQFEAYRELGFQTAHAMMCDEAEIVHPIIQGTLGKPLIECTEK